MNKKLFVIVISLLITGGCTSKYACNAPDGKTCKSMTTVYNESLTNGDDGYVYSEDEEKPDGSAQVEKSQMDHYNIQTVNPGDSIRRGPRTLRVWLTPWRDKEDNLYEPIFVNTVVDYGEWLINENKNFIQD